MNREEILRWRDKYDKEEDLYNKGVEEELRIKFNKNNCIDKNDLVRIVKWKFQGRLIGRQQRILKMLEGEDDDLITGVSKLAFHIKDDKKRVELLCTIDGIGTALASTILTFFDPANYGVFDIHAWRELFKKEPKSLFSDKKNVIRFFERLRQLSRKNELSCREIEKALFKINYDNSKRKK